MAGYKGIGNAATDGSTDTWLTVEWLQELKAIGLNTISIQYFWDIYENADGSYNMTAFGWLDRIVQRCEQAGMKIYLAHRTTWGVIPWYGGWLSSWRKSENGIADVFDPNGSLLPRIANFIEFIVARYDASPAVIGFNIENFPFHNILTPTQTEINQYHNYGIPTLFAAARKHSSKPIMICPIQKGLNYSMDMSQAFDTHYWFDRLPPPIDKNTIYLFDGWGITADLAPVSTYTKDALRAGFDGAIQFGKRYGVKVMPDEFGIPQPGSETDLGEQYMRDLLDVLNEFTDSWIYHFGAGPRTWAVLDEYAEKPGYSLPTSSLAGWLIPAGILGFLGLVWAATRKTKRKR
jgi:hypothetical protein